MRIALRSGREDLIYLIRYCSVTFLGPWRIYALRSGCRSILSLYLSETDIYYQVAVIVVMPFAFGAFRPPCQFV